MDQCAINYIHCKYIMIIKLTCISCHVVQKVDTDLYVPMLKSRYLCMNCRYWLCLPTNLLSTDTFNLGKWSNPNYACLLNYKYIPKDNPYIKMPDEVKCSCFGVLSCDAIVHWPERESG